MIQRSFLHLLLVGVLVAAFAAPALGQATPPFDRTIIVGGSGTNAANGTALITAVFAAAAAVPPPSAGNPWLVKVEPGVFDLSGFTLPMINFVDIEGSGRNATFIRSSPGGFGLAATIDVPAGTDVELRNLTVQNFASGQGAGITNSSTDFKLTQVNIEVESEGSSFGFVSFAGNPRVQTVFVRAAAKNNDATGFFLDAGAPVIIESFVFINNATPGDNRGFRIESGANPSIDKTSGVVFGGNRNTGVQVQGASATLTNNRWTVTGGSLARGLYATDDVFVEVQESTFQATGATTNVGIQNDTGFLTVQTSRVIAGAGASSIAVENVFSGQTDIDQSVLQGGLSFRNTFGGAFRIGSTQLSGPRAIGGGSAICAASYDGNYVAIGPGC
ncbi:MAG: hypothetical protein AAGC60_29180 [Acidobacteriota bacterium]